MIPSLHRLGTTVTLARPLLRGQIERFRHAAANDLFRGSGLMPGTRATIVCCSPFTNGHGDRWVVMEFGFADPPLRLKFDADEFAWNFSIG
jgi:hypothetical protein